MTANTNNTGNQKSRHGFLPFIPLLALLMTLAQGATAQDTLCQVHVATQPKGVVVILDSKTRGVTPLTLTAVTPGTHLLVLNKDGHYETRRTLSLEPQERTAIDLKMEAILGLVLIKAHPEGATILVNDAERGKSPLLITDLPLGNYRVRIEAPTFVSKEIELSIKDRIPIKIDTVLMANTATIEMTSEPSGARVLLNGLDKGLTPLTVDGIPAGEATLTINVAGHKPYSQKIIMEPGQVEVLNAVLTPLPATLESISIPPGARIYVNDKFRGKAPLLLDSLQPGTYRVRAEMVGFETMSRQLELHHAQNAIEEFRLWSNSGLLEVITEPAGVRIFIEGKERGFTVAATSETDRVSMPLTVRLPEGKHALQFSKQGYYGKTRTIEVTIDQTAIVHEIMQRRFIPNYEVVTDNGDIKGFFIEKMPNGDIRLEVRPGIRRTIPYGEIISAGPLRN